MKIFFYIFLSVIAILVCLFVLLINFSNAVSKKSIDLNKFEGAVESINCNTIKGWAWSPNLPNIAVDVKMVVDNEDKLANANLVQKADVERLDIASLITDDSGNHGFEIITPPQLKDSKLHKIYFYIMDPNDEKNITLIKNSENSLLCKS